MKRLFTLTSLLVPFSIIFNSCQYESNSLNKAQEKYLNPTDYILKKYEEELNVLKSFIKQDENKCMEKEKEINKITSFLNKQELVHKHCEHFLLNGISSKFTKGWERSEFVRIAMLLLQSINFISMGNIKENLFILKQNINYCKMNKLVLYEFYNNLLLILKKS